MWPIFNFYLGLMKEIPYVFHSQQIFHIDRILIVHVTKQFFLKNRLESFEFLVSSSYFSFSAIFINQSDFVDLLLIKEDLSKVILSISFLFVAW